MSKIVERASSNSELIDEIDFINIHRRFQEKILITLTNVNGIAELSDSSEESKFGTISNFCGHDFVWTIRIQCQGLPQARLVLSILSR